jgi:N-methylhydantoinase A/oxoprolinase/acetone carboxylase beta subunit
LIQELTRSSGGEAFPVTCGHELTTRLNAVRRATTVALNARLIPLLRELIGTVQSSLDNLEIAAPLMVVKGDGSLVRAVWAMQRPIETILSGPAASAVGACYLAKCDNAWVVDVGGTTTDIAALNEGHPLLNVEGARVGQWRTMVEAVDAHTVGLGGDSWVHFNEERRLCIGPQRVIPLCALAEQYPQVVKELEEQVADVGHLLFPGQFALAQRRETVGLAEEEHSLLAYLAEPRSLNDVLTTVRYSWALERRLGSLQERRLAVRAGFTPTDALHVLGQFVQWNVEASYLGAQLLAAQEDMPIEAFCEQVVAAVSDRVSTELVNKVLGDEGTLPSWDQEPAAQALLDRALGKVPSSGLDCQVSLRQPMVAVGAPVEAYLPLSAQQLGTDLHIPAYAEVANAVGAVAGGVVLQQRVQILPLDTSGSFRLHLPDRVYDFGSVQAAVAHAEREMPPYMESLARQAGAEQVEVRVTRVDHNAPVKAGWGQHIYLGTELFYRAVGRPSPTRLR